MLDPISNNVIAANTLKEGCEQLNNNHFDIVLLDLNLPDSSGRQTFTTINNCRKDLPVILITGSEDEHLALELIREGAQEYITKQQLNSDILLKSISYSIERNALLRDVRNQKERIQKIEEERTLIYKALIRSKEDFYRSVSESPLGIRIVSEDGETIYANKAILDIYGFESIDELIHTPVNKRYTPESYLEYKLRRAKRKQGQGEGTSKYQISILKKTGEVRHLQVYRKEVLWNDKKQYQVLYSDITDRKKAEEEITIKNEMLRNIIAEKDKFFSIIAHDLKGPLGTIVSATQFLSEEIQDMGAEEAREIMNSLKDSASNVYRLLENLLSWSQLKRNGVKFNPERIRLKENVESCIGALSEAAHRKNIEIELEVPGEMEIFADRNMLSAILRNLISNAIKFTPRRGRILVNSVYQTNKNIVIRISDSGIGVPNDLKKKLFRISEKTVRKGTEGEAGTGLGLLLCKEFVEKHGGEIEVESEPGKGSSFFLNFPGIKN